MGSARQRNLIIRMNLAELLESLGANISPLHFPADSRSRNETICVDIRVW